MEEIRILTTIALILFAGVLVSAFAKKVRIPDIIFLILVGAILGSVTFRNQPLVNFPNLFLTSLGLLALAMVVFESTSKVKLRQIDTSTTRSLKLVGMVLVLICSLFMVAAHYLFKLDWSMAVLLSTIMVGTSPAIVLPLLEGRSKILDLLKFEAILNTPLTVLLPFLIIDVITTIQTTPITATIVEYFIPFLSKFVSAIGTGMLVGIVLFKVIRKTYSDVFSPLAVIVAALLSYVIAENLGGNGVLAVTTLGLFFGNVYIKEKVELMHVGTVLAKSLYILVFVILGSIIKIPYSQEFFINTGLLFGIYLLVRFIAVSITCQECNFKEKLFMSLICAKGIAVAVVAFTLSTMTIPQINIVLDITLIFILYSVIVSAIASWFQPSLLEK